MSAIAYTLGFIHSVLESQNVHLRTVLNALAKTNVDQVNQSNLRMPVGEGPLHNWLHLDQSSVQSHYNATLPVVIVNRGD